MKASWAEILFSRKQQSHPRGDDDRERIMQARQAAEALFTKSQVGTPSVSKVGPTAKTAREPRVLPTISPLVPVLPNGSETAIVLSPPADEISRLQLARIRAWVKYGMTIAQAAQVCGVAVAEIERILCYPDRDGITGRSPRLINQYFRNTRQATQSGPRQ